MRAFRRSRIILPRHRPWSVASLLIAAACATTPAAEDSSSSANPVDIGYGTVNAEHEVGSVVSVEGPGTPDNLFRTLGQMLSKIPGVQVDEGAGGTLRVRIRGTGSFIGGKEPLWVLDGMAIQSGAGLAGINPNAIKSISVLKDPGDTAIFGSRGANGVILVRTRQGG